MKTLKIALLFFSFLRFSLPIYSQLASVKPNLLDTRGIISFRPADIMADPNMLMKVWIDEPIPKKMYTPEEIKGQKYLNKESDDAIRTYSPSNSTSEYTSIDFEEITPYTWKWVVLELVKPDSTITEARLRRPHWWIREVGADKVGKQVFLDMPELGAQGWATVKAIKVNQLDTRFWDEKREGDYVLRPITGFFTHTSSNIYKLYFGNNSKPLLVTGSHPIWSMDQNKWVPAEELKNNEYVKTSEGKTSLMSTEKLEGKQKVYNLEVYKDHNFFVSTDKILVHNSCWPWKNVNPSISELTANGGSCKLWATEIQKAVGGEVVHITPGYGGNTLGAVYNKAGKLITTKWAEHYAVRVGDMMYDRITGPAGMPINQYKSTLFQYEGSGLLFNGK